MKTRFRHIHFDEIGDLQHGGCYLIKNNKTNSILGYIEWYKPWRKYIVRYEEDAVFDETCTCDILDFLMRLKETGKDRKNGKI